MERLARSSIYICNNKKCGWARFIKKYGENLNKSAFLSFSLKDELLLRVINFLNLKEFELEKVEPAAVLLNKIGNGRNINERVDNGLSILCGKTIQLDIIKDKNYIEGKALELILKK